MENTLTREQFLEDIEKMNIELTDEYSDSREAVVDECKEGTPLPEALNDMYWEGWGVDQEKLDKIGDSFDPDKITIKEECGLYPCGDEDDSFVEKWMGELHYPIDGKDEVIAWMTSED